VPISSAQSGSGNIYFQISASTSVSWVALATGSTMTNSNMFLLYQDGAGNVTLSPRRLQAPPPAPEGSLHAMPTEDIGSTAARLTLLAGSGVDGDTITANIMCSNCQSRENGQMVLSSTDTDWVYARKKGSSLDTTDRNAMIYQHDTFGGFALDLTKATIASDANPFVARDLSPAMTAAIVDLMPRPEGLV